MLPVFRVSRIDDGRTKRVYQHLSCSFIVIYTEGYKKKALILPHLLNTQKHTNKSTYTAQ